MRTVYYNGKSFESLGLIIRKAIVPPNSAEKRRTISIPDGPVIIENTKVRDPVSFQIECTVVEPGKLRDIYAMCQKEGILILPDEPDKYYYGILTVSTPKNIILYYNNITFTMTAEPYAYAVNNPEIICSLQDGASWYKYTNVSNAGTAECEPVYRVTTPGGGSFDIWIQVNGKKTFGCRINVDEEDTIRIDVQNKIILNSHDQIITHKAVEDFTKLVLPPGDSTICISNCTQLKLVKNERWY